MARLGEEAVAAGGLLAEGGRVKWSSRSQCSREAHDFRTLI